ncbi:MAG: PAS domain S-box protein [Verrucomicrobia bacterium]|nr:PAS domain S-box protein [Verrucomicrobiota bacterium]
MKTKLSSPLVCSATRLGLAATAGWTLLLGAFLALDFSHTEHEVLEVAKAEARAAYRNDMIYRLWNADRGGVYVPVTESTPPNPHLAHVPQRDVTTASGQQLTLVNPAYMTRLVHELGRHEFGLRAHITSLKPLRPENAADAWESNALQRLARGEKEVSAVATVDGGAHLRFMAPMMTEERCLKCHAQQGYRVGDVRGGLAFAVPIHSEWLTPIHRHTRVSMLVLGSLWIVGLCGIWLAPGSVRSRLAQRQERLQALRESEERFRQLYLHMPIAYQSLNAAARIQEVNQAWLDLLGYTADEVRGRPISDFLPPTERDWGRARWAHFKETGRLEGVEFDLVHKNGARVTVSLDGRLGYDDQGTFVRTHCVLHDITDRKRAAAALNEQRERLERASVAGRVALWEWDLASGTLDWSSLVDAMLGFAPGALPRTIQGWKDLIHPDDSARIADAVQRHLDTDAPYDTAYRVRRANGSYVWWHDVGCAARDDTGRAVRMAGACVDITERKQAEEALRTSEARLHEAQRIALIGSWELEIPTNRLIWSEEIFRIFEMSPWTSAASYQAFLDAVHPDDRDAVHRAYAQSVKDRTPYDIIHRLLMPDGRVKYVHERCETCYDPDGRPLRSTGTVQDITERRQAEEAHLRLAKAVEQAAESIVITDVQGTILYVNPAFERTTGYSRQEALGHNPRLLQSGRHDRGFYDQMWNALNRGEVWHGHFINRRKDGSLYEEDASISPIRNGCNRIVNFVAVKRDVTREMLLEAQLRQAQKMEAVGQLAGGVAHDFNNILAAILMHLSLLQDESDLTPEMRASLKELEAGASRAASLTRQLLMFSRRQIMQPKALDLNDLLDDLLKMLRRLLGENIDVVCQGKAETLWIEADPGMIEQVVMNLCVNARDAMPGGGRLTIDTLAVEVDPEAAQANAEARPGRFVCLSVADTGTGMNEATLKRIFEPFFTTKEPGHGTGLGLATVYGIVKQHQRWIEVKSQVGVGSVFRVFLPARKEAPPPKPVVASAPIPRGRETVLVVEDDDALRRIAAANLRHFGYRVLEAANGMEAVQRYDQHHGRIDLLLTDMVMPEGMTGLDLAGRLQEINPALKVIISSGYALDTTQSRALADNGITYLTKPYEASTLAATVRQCLDS